MACVGCVTSRASGSSCRNATVGSKMETLGSGAFTATGPSAESQLESATWIQTASGGVEGGGTFSSSLSSSVEGSPLLSSAERSAMGTTPSFLSASALSFASCSWSCCLSLVSSSSFFSSSAFSFSFSKSSLRRFSR